MHDIGIVLVQGADGEVGFEIWAGGGLGRTPMIAKKIRDFLPAADLLSYLEAMLRVYNRFGRRDNKYKARIKITVHENGLEKMQELVEARFAELRPQFGGIDQEMLKGIEAQFTLPQFKTAPTDAYDAAYANDPVFRAWVDTNITAHRNADYAIVSISIKNHGETPGDATAEQMATMADLAEQYAHDELRISHEQNVILPHVHRGDLPALHAALKQARLAAANIGLISDMIVCPGMDYCALATARSIPIGQQISTRFNELKLEHDIGELKLKISGCINACGHHHVGNIGILGVDKKGEEFYQVTLGGQADENASIGKIIGPGFASDAIVDAIETIIETYLSVRQDDESFIGTLNRLGQTPFKEALYGTA